MARMALILDYEMRCKRGGLKGLFGSGLTWTGLVVLAVLFVNVPIMAMGLSGHDGPVVEVNSLALLNAGIALLALVLSPLVSTRCGVRSLGHYIPASIVCPLVATYCYIIIMVLTFFPRC